MTETDEGLEETRTEDRPATGDPGAKSWSSRTRWGVVAVIVIALLAASAFIIVRRGQLPADAVLRFDGNVITKADYTKRVNALSALYGVKPPTSGAEEDSFRRDATKSIAVSMILDKAAKQQKVVISEQEASAALDKVIGEQLPGGQSDFTQFLSTSGVSEADVLDEVTRQLATIRLFDKVTGDVVAATDEDIEKYFADHRSEMASVERRRIANIVVATQREAGEVLAEARRGTQFKTLASRYSLDSSSKDNGGDLGWITQDELASDFAKASFAAKIGVPFGPVKSEFGWNVGVVTRVRASQPLSLDQVREQLRTELLNQRKLSAWRDWLAEQIKGADIEYADDYRPNDPDAPPTDMPTTTP